MSAEDVVAESLAALARGRAVCVPGFKNRFMTAAGKAPLIKANQKKTSARSNDISKPIQQLQLAGGSYEHKE